MKKELLIGFKKDNQITFLISKNLATNDKKLEYLVNPYLVSKRMGNNYSIFPAYLLDVKLNLKNIKLLGNGVVWFDEKAYQIDADNHEFIEL